MPWERNFPAQHETHDTTSARSLSVVAMHARSLSRSPTLCASLSPLHLSLSLWLSWAFTPLSICSNLCARLTWVQLFVIVAASLCVCECVSVHEQSCQLFRLHCFSLAHCAAHYYTIYIVFFLGVVSAASAPTHTHRDTLGQSQPRPKALLGALLACSFLINHFKL